MIKSRAGQKRCSILLLVEYAMHTWVSKIQKSSFIFITLLQAQLETT